MKKSEKIEFFSVRENGTLIENVPERTTIKFGVWQNISFVIVEKTRTSAKVKNPCSGQILTVPFGTMVKID